MPCTHRGATTACPTGSPRSMTLVSTCRFVCTWPRPPGVAPRANPPSAHSTTYPCSVCIGRCPGTRAFAACRPPVADDEVGEPVVEHDARAGHQLARPELVEQRVDDARRRAVRRDHRQRRGVGGGRRVDRRRRWAVGAQRGDEALDGAVGQHVRQSTWRGIAERRAHRAEQQDLQAHEGVGDRDVVGREPAGPELLEHPEGDEHQDAGGDRPIAVHRHPAVRHRQRGNPLAAMGGEVVEAERAAAFGHVIGDLLGDHPSVEPVAAIGSDRFEGLGEVGLREPRTPGQVAPGDDRGQLVAALHRRDVGERAGEPLIEGEPVTGEAPRRARGDRRTRPRAEALVQARPTRRRSPARRPTPGRTAAPS